MSQSIRIIKRIVELGPLGCWKRITHHAKRHYYNQTTQQSAINRSAHTTWQTLQKQLNAATATHCARQLFMQSAWHDIQAHPLFKIHQPELYRSTPLLLAAADNLFAHEFTLFGCTVRLPEQNIPWHTDVTIPVRQQQGITLIHDYLTTDLRTTFYRSIKIPTIRSMAPHEYASDIKVPWELSRLQQLFTMGKAYEYYTATNNTIKAKACALWVKNHLADWAENNPYLLGVNWACPMDVAIRSINIAWALYFFAHETTMDEAWWQTMLCLMYDHAIYLEHNWEVSDKPNNHYLADLVGYLYLCLAFKQIPYFNTRLSWAFEQFTEQLHQQILPDGTSYEGSTAYHRLDTEMVLHAALIGTTNNLAKTKFVHTTLASMLSFLQDCTSLTGRLITIGDDDSGKLITGITTPPCQEKTLHSYQQFGLTIVRSPRWHLSLRHATFKNTQPSGHFHQDQLAITLAIKGISLIVDPGSYAYTSNPDLRNYLRSWQAHATFACAKNTKLSNARDLFQLSRRQEMATPVITRQENELITLQATHSQDSCNTKKMIRTVRITPITVTLEDSVVATISSQPKNMTCTWNFPLHPAIKAHQQRDHSWLLCYQNLPVCSLISSLPLTISPSFYSPSYGVITPTTALSCSFTPTPHQSLYTTFTSN